MQRERPDRAAKLLNRRTTREYVVKMTLNKFCGNVRLRQEIERSVQGITRVAVEASRFLNFFVLYNIETNTEIPEMDQSFFYWAFTHIAGSNFAPERHGNALLEYRCLFGIREFDYKYISQSINYTGLSFLTNCQNHIVLNIKKRLKKQFKL